MRRQYHERLGGHLPGCPRSGEVSGLAGLALSVVERALIDSQVGGPWAADARAFLQSPGCERLLEAACHELGHEEYDVEAFLARFRRNGDHSGD